MKLSEPDLQCVLRTSAQQWQPTIVTPRALVHATVANFQAYAMQTEAHLSAKPPLEGKQPSMRAAHVLRQSNIFYDM